MESYNEICFGYLTTPVGPYISSRGRTKKEKVGQDSQF